LSHERLGDVGVYGDPLPSNTVIVMNDERAAVKRWLAGQRASALVQRTLQATEGPRPARAVAQSRSALSALETMGRWPGPRDAVSDRAIAEVRRRWVRIQQRARAARS
jgi:hypothetical protein